MTLQVNHLQPLSGSKSYEQVSAKENLEDLNEKLEKYLRVQKSQQQESKSEENFKGLFDDIGVNSNSWDQQ